MKADTIDLNHLFWTGVRYEVPMFQRPYVWVQDRQWEPLWEDISTIAERLLEEQAKATPEEIELGMPARNTPPHFLGAVVLDQMLSPPGEIERRNIVDGQQRLTTLQLLLAAVRDIAAEVGSDEAERFMKLTENDKILCKVPDDRFKVWPTNADRGAFRLVMHGTSPGPGIEVAERILAAHEYFKTEIADWIKGDTFASQSDRLNALRTTLWSHVKLVSINLEQADDAQVIFESLNARGTPLLAADLIKNYVFQKAQRQNGNVEALYNHYWKPLDDQYWRTTIRQGRLNRPRVDVFFYHWLTMTSGKDVLVGRLYESFKETTDKDDPVEKTLDELSDYAEVFRSFERFKRNSLEEVFFYRLDATQTTTATPLLLYLFGLPSGQLDDGQRDKALQAIESWLIRRMLCRGTTKNYNLILGELLGRVRQSPERAGDLVEGFLAGQQGESRRWPTDREVRSAVASFPLYRLLSHGRLRIVLEALETQMRAPGYAEEDFAPRNLTIEHVMPQAWQVHWPIQPDAEPELAAAERVRLVHTLGNLTLITGKLNSAQSHSPWLKKREILDKHTVLRINKELLNMGWDHWDESSIRQRGEQLATLILKVWPAPTVGDGALHQPFELTDLPAARNPALESQESRSTATPSLRADVRAFLDARIPQPEPRAKVDQFLTEILKLPDVTASVGRSAQTKDGWSYSVLVRRKGFGPALMYVYANRKVLFRLAEVDARGIQGVEFGKRKPGVNYLVRCSMGSDEGFASCVELAKRAYEKAIPGRASFDWSELHELLSAIPRGRWTTYGDLAQVIGTAAQPLGTHIASCPECPNAQRVLGTDGRPRPNFAWTDPTDTRTQEQALASDGVQFTAAIADPGQRLSVDDLVRLITGESN